MKRLKAKEKDHDVPIASFLGGMRFGYFNATIPLVRLELFIDKLRLKSSSRLLRRVIPILQTDYSEITEVQVVSNAIGEGIRIRTNDSDRVVVFWTFKPQPVLVSMQKLGVNVNDERGRFHFGNPER